MRFLRISTFSQAYLNGLYRENTRLGRQGYAAQLAAIFYDSHAQADSYSYYLNDHNYECREIVANAAQLQEAWCKENGADFKLDSFVRELPVEYARRFRPEVVFLDKFSVFDSGWVQYLRASCPSIKLVLGFCGIAPPSYNALRGYDVVLTPVASLARAMSADGLNVRVFRHAFDPRVLDRIVHSGSESFDATFIGSVIRSSDFHQDRARLLEALSGVAEVRVHSTDKHESQTKQYSRLIAYEIISFARRLGVRDVDIARVPLIGRYAALSSRPTVREEHPMWRRLQPAVYGLKYYDALARSRVTLNAHAECAGESAGNMRLFEATGVGTCLLTDHKRDLVDLYEPDAEVLTFRCAEEAASKLKWILEHEEDRRSIAAAGKARALRSHNYRVRVQELDEIVRKALP